MKNTIIRRILRMFFHSDSAHDNGKRFAAQDIFLSCSGNGNAARGTGCRSIKWIDKMLTPVKF